MSGPPFKRLSDKEYDYFDKQYQPFMNHIEKKGFSAAHSGSFRRVYERKNVVIKVPRNQDGVEDNMSEALGWHKYRSNPTQYGIYLAPCRLLPNKCLMMVKVDIYMRGDDKPDWSKDIDSGQVGLYRGRVVAYDFGLELTERRDWEKEWQVTESFYNTSHFGKRGL